MVFVGSPIEEDEKQLTRIGKLLKKNNVRLAEWKNGSNRVNRSDGGATAAAVMMLIRIDCCGCGEHGRT